MKILLIYVIQQDFAEQNLKKGFFYELFKKKGSFQRSLTIPILAALIPEEHTVEVVEGTYEDVDFDKHYDLVGISFMTEISYLAYEISDEFRKRGVTVVMGGWHSSALPLEVKQHADAVFIGESEDTWPQFLKDFEKGMIKPFYEQEKPVDPAAIPNPRVDVYNGKSSFNVQATRGCPYGCVFCAITHMRFRNIFRKRPIGNVIKEINRLPNKTIFFNDNSLTVDPSYSKELFRDMNGLDKNFFGYGNIDVLGQDDEFLKLASEAGCFAWVIGLESICQDSLKEAGKKTNQVDSYLSSIKNIRNHGMAVIGFFVFGFDHDTANIFDLTNDFVRKSDIDIPNAFTLTPYPGTPLYDRLEWEGRILTKDWSKYNSTDVVFQPKNMSAEELMVSVKDLRNKWDKSYNLVIRTLKGIRLSPTAFFYVSNRNLINKLLKY